MFNNIKNFKGLLQALFVAAALILMVPSMSMTAHAEGFSGDFGFEEESSHEEKEPEKEPEKEKEPDPEPAPEEPTPAPEEPTPAPEEPTPVVEPIVEPEVVTVQVQQEEVQAEPVETPVETKAAVLSARRTVASTPALAQETQIVEIPEASVPEAEAIKEQESSFPWWALLLATLLLIVLLARPYKVEIISQFEDEDGEENEEVEEHLYFLKKACEKVAAFNWTYRENLDVTEVRILNRFRKEDKVVYAILRDGTESSEFLNDHEEKVVEEVIGFTPELSDEDLQMQLL